MERKFTSPKRSQKTTFLSSDGFTPQNKFQSNSRTLAMFQNKSSSPSKSRRGIRNFQTEQIAMLMDKDGPTIIGSQELKHRTQVIKQDIRKVQNLALSMREANEVKSSNNTARKDNDMYFQNVMSSRQGGYTSQKKARDQKKSVPPKSPTRTTRNFFMGPQIDDLPPLRSDSVNQTCRKSSELSQLYTKPRFKQNSLRLQPIPKSRQNQNNLTMQNTKFVPNKLPNKLTMTDHKRFINMTYADSRLYQERIAHQTKQAQESSSSEERESIENLLAMSSKEHSNIIDNTTAEKERIKRAIKERSSVGHPSELFSSSPVKKIMNSNRKPSVNSLNSPQGLQTSKKFSETKKKQLKQPLPLEFKEQSEADAFERQIDFQPTLKISQQTKHQSWHRTKPLPLHQLNKTIAKHPTQEFKDIRESSTSSWKQTETNSRKLTEIHSKNFAPILREQNQRNNTMTQNEKALVQKETSSVPQEQKKISTEDFMEILKNNTSNAIELGGVRYQLDFQQLSQVLQQAQKSSENKSPLNDTVSPSHPISHGSDNLKDVQSNFSEIPKPVPAEPFMSSQTDFNAMPQPQSATQFISQETTISDIVRPSILRQGTKKNKPRVSVRIKMNRDYSNGGAFFGGTQPREIIPENPEGEDETRQIAQEEETKKPNAEEMPQSPPSKLPVNRRQQFRERQFMTQAVLPEQRERNQQTQNVLPKLKTEPENLRQEGAKTERSIEAGTRTHRTDPQFEELVKEVTRQFGNLDVIRETLIDPEYLPKFKRGRSFIQRGEKTFSQREMSEVLNYLIILNEQSDPLTITQQSGNKLHIGFLFASPLILRDKGGFKNQHLTKNADKNKVKHALINYYHKEQKLDLQSAEKVAMSELKLDTTTNVDLSDETKVRDVTWGNWKTRMNIMDSAKFEFYLKGFNQEDLEMVQKLRKAQEEQGDNKALRKQEEDTILKEKRFDKILKKLNENEKQKQVSDWSLDFLAQLDFVKEQKNIKFLMKQSQTQTTYKSSVATRYKFIEMLSQSPKILHISCHGLKIELKQGIFGKDRDEKENCLIFEKENGEGELVDAKSLNKLIKQALPKLDVIFLAACNSEFAGKVFLKCDAEHVICIQKNKEVLDSAAILFTETFYQAIFNGDCVCEAFDKAKESVEWRHGRHEANIFRIFVHEQKYELDDLRFDEKMQSDFYKSQQHRALCRKNILGKIEEGKYDDKSQQMIMKQLPAKVKTLRFRELEVIELIDDILDTNDQIFMLLGMHGIGKSSIARNALNYICERKFIHGGVMWIQLKGVRDIYTLTKLIQSNIYDALTITRQEVGRYTRDSCTYENLQDFIVKFFSNPVANFKGKLKKDMSKHQGKEKLQFIVCLDNAEEMIIQSEDKFQKLLKNLTERCRNLKFVITSNKPLDPNQRIVESQSRFISDLKPLQAAELFLETVQKGNQYKVKPDDIIDLIYEQPTYPIRNFIEKHKTKIVLKGDQEKVREYLLKERLVELYRRQIEALSYHDLFKQLSGNPTSIVILACAIANKYVKSQTIAEIYVSAILGGNRIESIDEIEEDKESIKSKHSEERGYSPAKIVRNNYSLEFTIRMSIKLLEENDPLCTNLFYFLGCLPGGVTMKQLKKMWDDPEKPIEKLEQMSFLEAGVGKKVLTAIFQEFVEKDINDDLKEQYMQEISDFYLEILQEFYQANSGYGQLAASESGDSINNAEKKIGNGFQRGFLDAVQEKEDQMRSIFEKVINEVRNIEYVIQYFIRVSEKNKLKMPSQIETNASLHLFDSPLKIPKTPVLPKKQSHPGKKSQDKLLDLPKNASDNLYPIDEELSAQLSRRSSADRPNDQETMPYLHFLGSKKDSKKEESKEKKQSNIKEKIAQEIFRRISVDSDDEEEEEFNIDAALENLGGRKLDEIGSFPVAKEEISESSSSEDLDRQQDEIDQEHLNLPKPRNAMRFQSADTKHEKMQRLTPDKKDRGVTSQTQLQIMKRTSVVSVQQEQEMTQIIEFKLAKRHTKALDATWTPGSGRNKKRGQSEYIKKSDSTRLSKKARSMDLQDNERMTSSGQFILLFAANIFLSSDLEYCLHIAQLNFSFIDNTSLFEANILRFRSLAADQLYEHKSHYKISEHDKQVNLRMLFLAFHSANNALKIYEGDTRKHELSTALSNHYGKALQEFQLGYLYERNASTLIDPVTKYYLQDCKERYPRKYAIDSKIEAIDRAIEHYVAAYKSFKKMDHLFGLYITKKRESSLMDTYNTYLPRGEEISKDKPKSEKEKCRQKLKKWEQRWKEYKEKNGTSNCPYVERYHGDEISLLTEIVYYNNSRQVLFDENEGSQERLPC